MSRLIPGNHKHLTLEDRLFIEKSLNEGLSFKEISRYLCKDPTTISREVKKHRLSDWYHKGTFYNAHNFCIHRYHCQKTNACQKILICGIKCASCPTCNQTCKDYVMEKCSRLVRAPHVCNGCEKKINRCTIARKYRYDALFADRKYRDELVGTRTGINITQKDLRKIDKVITPLIDQGQSPYQIVTNHPELGISVRTMYTYLDNGLFTARNIDLKRKVKFKPRKSSQKQITDREIFKGRSFEDFQALGLENWVEMDTVRSSKESGKVLLTFFFKKEKLFLAYLMNRNTTASVRSVFDRLEKRLDTYTFLSMFEYILSDRGYQYISKEFRQKIVKAGMTQSMSRVAHCIDNGPMEGFWGVMKREMYYGRKCKTKDELIQSIEGYMNYYTIKRVQRNLGVLTPMEYHDMKLLEAA